MLRNKEAVTLGHNALVEADENFIGGKYGNMHSGKRKKMQDENTGGFTIRLPYLALLREAGN